MQRTMNHSIYFEPRRQVGLILLAISFLMPLQGLAQGGTAVQVRRLVAGDVIQISVPGRPQMNRSLTLDSAGKVSIPEVGDVTLAGLTASEAELVMRQWLRLYHPSLDNIELTLQSRGSNGMNYFLIGQVMNPGEYNFPQTPSYWELLRTAGGPTEIANLRQVRLVRETGGRTEVTEMDLSGLYEGEDIPEIELQPGDTLIFPALLEGVSAVPTANGVKVFGAVAVPTVVNIKVPTPMLDVLMLAGAPSAESDISKVYWVHNVGDVSQAQVIDVKEYLEYGNPVGNPLVYPGDTVKVDYSRESLALRTFTFILVSMASIATIYLAFSNAARYD